MWETRHRFYDHGEVALNPNTTSETPTAQGGRRVLLGLRREVANFITDQSSYRLYHQKSSPVLGKHLISCALRLCIARSTSRRTPIEDPTLNQPPLHPGHSLIQGFGK